MADRGLSTAVGYALVIGVVTLLITLLFVSMAGYVENQERETARSTLETVGHSLAADLEAADRLATAENETQTVILESSLPARIVDSQYTIHVNASGSDELHLRTHDPEVTVTVAFATDLAVEERRIEGGTLLIESDEDGHRLVVRDG